MEENTTQKGNMTPLIIGIVALLVVAGGFYLYKSNSSSRQMEDSFDIEQGMTEEEMMQEDTMMEEGSRADTMMQEEGMEDVDVVEIDMEAGSFFYAPDVITVKQGQTVRINFTASDMMHDLNIDELDVDGPITESGETTTIEFVADQAGEFEYYCSVGQHRANGQVGTLTVEE